MRHRYDAELLGDYMDGDVDFDDEPSIELGANVGGAPDGKVTFQVKPVRGGGWQGELIIPAGIRHVQAPDGSTVALPAAYSVKGPKGKTERGAARKAGRVVGKILDSPEFQQVQQALPPQAQAAIVAIQMARKSKALRRIANKGWKTVKGWFD